MTELRKRLIYPNKFVAKNLTEAMDQFQSYEKHKRKLDEIKWKRTKTTVNDQSMESVGSKFTLSHARSNTYHANQRQIAILRENQYLVRKIAAISVNAKPKPQPCRRDISKLYDRTARREHERVHLENQRILTKILNPLPTVSKKKQEEQYNDLMKYQQKLHKVKDVTYENLHAGCDNGRRIKRRLAARLKRGASLANSNKSLMLPFRKREDEEMVLYEDRIGGQKEYAEEDEEDQHDVNGGTKKDPRVFSSENGKAITKKCETEGEVDVSSGIRRSEAVGREVLEVPEGAAEVCEEAIAEDAIDEGRKGDVAEGKGADDEDIVADNYKEDFESQNVKIRSMKHYYN